MASTIPIQTTVSWCQVFLRSAPLTNVNSVPNEPALTIANWTAGMIINPSFPWRWNRQSGSFVAAPTLTDFQVSLPNFGWLERATLVDTTDNNTTSRELEIQLNVGLEKNPSEIRFISARLDDNQGNITFRVSPPSATTVTIYFDYQLAAPTFTSLSQTWNPIPDYMSYLYNQGFLFKAYEYWADAERMGLAAQTFIGALISANAGLSDSQIDIFNQLRLNTGREAIGQQPPLAKKTKALF